jgi:competence protein ComEC
MAISIPFHLQFLQGVSIHLLLVSVGIALVFFSKSKHHTPSVSDRIILIGEIIKVPELGDKNYKTEIALLAHKDGNHWKELSSTLIVYLEKGDSTLHLNAGNKIIFNAQPTNIKGKQNPFGFDFANYMALKNINQSVYLRQEDYQLLSEEEKGLKNRALNLRQKIIDEFAAHNIAGDNLAVLSALTLGYKNKLDEKVRTAYSGAGAMHVLAVSGLHVGIIYMVLKVLLSWLTFFSRLKKLKFAIILVALWVYAFITGLSPSVMRASIMFSFVLAGKIIDKRVSIYNSLAASAFFLLMANPFLLFEVGFQLSYIAVLGIVFFHPKINGLFYSKYMLFNYLWSLTAVSIAAQLATFPITIYHFHQFPSYFWIANMGVTISAILLIFITVVFIALTTIPALANFIAQLINGILDLNLRFLQWINDLPGAVINQISISSMQVFTLYVLIIALAVWLINKKYPALISIFTSVFLFGLLHVNNYYLHQNQKAICVYQLNSESAIQFIHEKESVWLTSENNEKSRVKSLINESNMFWNSTQNNYFSIENLTDSIIKQNIWYYNSGFWAVDDYKGLIINSHSKIPRTPMDSINIDYIFITGNPSFSLKDISEKIKYNEIIIDGSVPKWKAKQFINEKSTLEPHLTKEKGAFIIASKI